MKLRKGLVKSLRSWRDIFIHKMSGAQHLCKLFKLIFLSKLYYLQVLREYYVCVQQTMLPKIAVNFHSLLQGVCCEKEKAVLRVPRA